MLAVCATAFGKSSRRRYDCHRGHQDSKLDANRGRSDRHDLIPTRGPDPRRGADPGPAGEAHQGAAAHKYTAELDIMVTLVTTGKMETTSSPLLRTGECPGQT